MRVSIFTPTHKPTFLADAWETVRRQTHENWEWVVVVNGPGSDIIAKFLAQTVGGDPRVKIVMAPPDVQGVGALKRFACSKCSGDLLLELDHDDLLTEDCLAVVVARAAKCPPLTFIYSDTVTESLDGKAHLYLKEYGWRHYDWTHKGRVRPVNASHAAHPRALCEIMYAPDHVRVWTRDAYTVVGGHNPALHVCDDHELLIRTYLKGVHFEHVKQPLYIHRMSPECTSVVHKDKILSYTNQLRDRFFGQLTAEWCKRRGLHTIDLGGAHNCPDGYTPLDRALPRKFRDVDYTDPKNWGDGIPFDVFELAGLVPDNSVGCFRAFDFFEHIPIGSVVPLMNLLYQKLVPGGIIISHTPAVCDAEGKVGRGAYQDPDHKSFWTENNFWYFTDQVFAKYENGAVKCRFQTIRAGHHYPTDWHKQHQVPYVIWDAMALKDDDKNYLPGPRKI
jgi:glycosyltransferase involved in cell wall biosynthesis